MNQIVKYFFLAHPAAFLVLVVIQAYNFYI